MKRKSFTQQKPTKVVLDLPSTTFAHKNSAGFTLIELLVVIAIIAMLAAVAIASLSHSRTKARDSRRMSDLKALATALEFYYLDNGKYPSHDTGGCISDINLANDLSPEYMGGLPKDPKNNQYCYYYKTEDNGAYYKAAGYMEASPDMAKGDGGTSDTYYEVFSIKGGSQVSLNDSDLFSAEMNWDLYQDSSIVAYWKMDEPSWNGDPGEVIDSSGYENNGTSYNGAITTGTGCISGNCGSFDGTDDYIDCGNENSIDFSTGDFSVDVLFKTNTSDVVQSILDKGTGNHIDGYGIMIFNDNRINFLTDGDDNPGSKLYLYSDNTINIDTWYYLVALRKNGIKYMFINGVQQNNTQGDSRELSDPSRHLVIGKSDVDSGGYFNGFIDEVHIYNRALTACEVCKRCKTYESASFCSDCDDSGC